MNLSISQRCKGNIDGNGKVTVTKILSYDLVSLPGFDDAYFHLMNDAKILRQNRKKKINRIFEKNND